MKTLRYADTDLVTGDEIALAVLEYSRALADEGTAETIEIPVRAPDGEESRATLLIGPASQIVAVDGPEGGDELVADEVVRELHARIRRLEPSAGPDDEPRDDTWSHPF